MPGRTSPRAKSVPRATGSVQPRGIRLEASHAPPPPPQAHVPSVRTIPPRSSPRTAAGSRSRKPEAPGAPDTRSVPCDPPAEASGLLPVQTAHPPRSARSHHRFRRSESAHTRSRHAESASPAPHRQTPEAAQPPGKRRGTAHNRSRRRGIRPGSPQPPAPPHPKIR